MDARTSSKLVQDFGSFFRFTPSNKQVQKNKTKKYALHDWNCRLAATIFDGPVTALSSALRRVVAGETVLRHSQVLALATKTGTGNSIIRLVNKGVVDESGECWLTPDRLVAAKLKG